MREASIAPAIEVTRKPTPEAVLGAEVLRQAAEDALNGMAAAIAWFRRGGADFTWWCDAANVDGEQFRARTLAAIEAGARPAKFRPRKQKG